MVCSETHQNKRFFIDFGNYTATNSRINFFYNREIRAFVAVTLIELHFGYYATLSRFKTLTRLIQMMVADPPFEIEERTKF